MKATMLAAGEERTFALIFDTGDEVVAGLQQFAVEQHLTASRISAIGAFNGVTLGFFDWDTKDYRRIPVDEQVEVVALLGDIALGDDGPIIHAHAVIGRSDGTTRGGHLLSGVVRPTLEVLVEESPTHLRRRSDPVSGLPLIDIADGDAV
jgi:predicted DNA-binding protein with PD1-like motif